MAFTKAGLWGPQAIIGATGHPQPGATATLYLPDEVTLASLWTTSAKSVAAPNPTQADIHANLHFWTDPGQYRLRVNAGTVVTWLDVEVPIDPGEAAQDQDVTAAIATAEAYADGIVAAALAAALAGSQPLDADLTAIAALSTTAYGRAFLALADAAAGRTALGLGTAATHAVGDFDAAGAAAAATAALVNSAPGTLDTLNELATALADDPAFATTMTNALAGKQPLDSDLTAIAALSTTAFGRSALALADSAALRVLAGTVIGTDVQAHDSDLDAIAALATTAFGRALLVLADAAALRTAAGLGTAATAATTDFDAAGTASAAITALINGAPGALDTLNELATALGDDAAFATTVTNALATKLIAGATSGSANQAALPAAVAHTHEIVKTDDGGVYLSTGSSWVQLVAPSGTYAPLGSFASTLRTPGRGGRTMIVDLGQAGHGWVASSGAQTSNMADTSDFVHGSQAAWVTSKGIASAAGIRNTALTSIDLSAKKFEVSVKVDDWTHVAGILLYLGDTGFTNFYIVTLWTSNSGTALPPGDNGEWVTLTADWTSITATTGSPNKAAVTAAQIAVLDDNTGNSVKMHANHVAHFPGSSAYPNGAVLLGFDDGYANQYLKARPYMDKYGFAGTAFPIIDLVGTSGYMTLAQIKSLHKINGWEIGGHSDTVANHNAVGGLNSLTFSQFDQVMRTIKQWLLSNGLPADTFAWPQGYFTATTEEQVRNYFTAARHSASPAYETLPLNNRTRIRSLSGGPGLNATTVNAIIDNAFTYGTFLSLHFHDIVDSGATGAATLTATFQSIVDHIAVKGIPVRTLREVLMAA